MVMIQTALGGRERELAEKFLRQQERGAFSAGQLVVRRGGRVCFELCTGTVATGATTHAVNGETRFQIMSASKPVVAIAIALLEQRGLVDVDRPVAELWPEFAAAGKGDITLLDILLHRSGLLTPELDSRPELWEDWDALVTELTRTPPYFARGTQAYNPLAFGWILAEVVRRVAGAPLPDFVRRNFPAELSGLEFMRSSAHTSACARTLWRGPERLSIGGHDIAGRFEEVNNQISAVRALVPGGGMYTNARSLAAFYETLACRGVLPSGEAWLSPEIVERYTRRSLTRWDSSVRSFVPLGRGFARGWLGPHPFGWWNTQSRFGHAGGFSVVAFGDDTSKAGVAIVTDTNRSLSDLVRRFAPLGSAVSRMLQT